MDVAEYIADEGDRALAGAMLIASLFGVVVTLLLGTLGVAHHDRWYLGPTLFSVWCAIYCAVLHVLSRKRLMRGGLGTVLLFGLVSGPTLFYAIAALTGLPWAAFTTGPISYLYAFVVVVASFRLSPRLSLLLGACAAIELYVVQRLAQPFLTSIDLSRAPMLRRDLVDPILCALRSAMIFGVGIATCALALIGRRLITRVAAEAEERRLLDQTFGEYVSPEVREAILAHKRSPSSRRHRVAVLFSDLRGFSTLSEDADPAEVVATLNAYFERMVRAIAGEHGVVDKFIGDAVMATFDGVAPLADPAGAALRAARAMRRELAALNEERSQSGKPSIDNGIGLHFGEVLIGPIGGAGRSEFTVIGDAVNVAARLESLTKEKGQAILLSDSIYDGLVDKHDLVELGEVVVKGRKKPTRVYGA